MTPYVDCVFAQKHLEAFVDRELPVNDEVLVESHLRWCTTCAARVQDLQTIGVVVRGRSRREPMHMPSDRELSVVRRELLRVSDAERNRSMESRIRELGRRCADLRFVWPAVGASAAVALCIGLAETMWRATAVQQPTSLAAMIESLSDPGSDRNPLRLDGNMLVPRVLNNQGAVAHAVLDEHGIEGDDEVFAVAAVVTRDGKVGTYELLRAGTVAAGQHRGSHNNEDMADLLDAVRQSRFAPAQGPGIFTKEEFADFAVRLEYKVPPGGNNGLAIRYPGKGQASYDAMCEIQILDDDAGKYAKLDPRQFNGSVYGMVAPHRGYQRPAGEWNVMEVTVHGPIIQVELNGSRILDADVSKVTEFKDGRPHPGKDRTSGHFGFCGHNDPVEFRNIRIKRLMSGEK